METVLSLTESQIVTASPAADITGLVGNTPLIPLKRISAKLPVGVQVLAKAEWFNPGGSVKDRPALNILRAALAKGELTAGKRLLDSTSGNMGIAYATFGAALGIPATLAMPANASRERIAILRTLGAELVLTDPLEGSDGAIQVARRMARERPELYYYANQYDNPANWQAHYQSTGPEVVHQTDGHLTHFVAGMGTSGTITGVGRYLRQFNPSIQLVAVQPNAPLHGLEGLKHLKTTLTPAIFDPTLPDRTLEVSTEAAYAMVRRLGREEGLFVGISSAAAAVAALRLAQELEEGVIVVMFPDAGYKYLSDEALWDKIER